MQIFLFLNALAGRWPVLDALMRGVYVGTTPLLAVVLLALLTLAPRAWGAPSRGKIALATIISLGGAALLMWGIGVSAQSLDLGTLSPRPWMTRWVNLLIVEPQDNSFPCAEAMVAAILSVGIGFSHRGWGVFAATSTLLLMVARLFCGSNYAADVIVGALLGVGLMISSLALCRAPKPKRERIWQGALGTSVLGLTALGTFLVGAQMPRFEGKLQLPWAKPALASPKSLARNAPIAARRGLEEGEGMAHDGATDASRYEGEAEAQAMNKRATLFLPAAEAHLRAVLTPLALPF